jgi:hypothetical protein
MILPDYYKRYVALLPTDDLLENLVQQKQQMAVWLGSISEEESMLRYAPDKWSVKELWQHVNDTERVYQYRALRFARMDKTVLPGFDHDAWGPVAGADNRSWKSIREEFLSIRDSGISLFGSFTAEMMEQFGEANGNPISVKAIGLIISGHALHHSQIIRERYLKTV